MSTIRTTEEKPVDLSQVLKEIVFRCAGSSYTLQEIIQILKYNHKYKITFTLDELITVLNKHLQITEKNDLTLVLVIIEKNYLFGWVGDYQMKFRRI
ncbi:MAG: hypothetical protein Q8R40_00285 [bacterium]|nr:hypothetical protein [bacterium]